MILKKGTRVRIKEYDGNEHGVGWNKELMGQAVGKVFEVSGRAICFSDCYGLKGNHFTWHIAWLEPLLFEEVIESDFFKEEV